MSCNCHKCNSCGRHLCNASLSETAFSPLAKYMYKLMSFSILQYCTSSTCVTLFYQNRLSVRWLNVFTQQMSWYVLRACNLIVMTCACCKVLSVCRCELVCNCLILFDSTCFCDTHHTKHCVLSCALVMFCW
jgi:hypothetical protein